MAGLDGEVLYFAYGSNMSPERMMLRVPGAHVIGVGHIRGWTVAERLYADISKVPHGTTHGVVYEMRVRDVVDLDRYEGYPSVYDRRWCNVHMADGTVRKALVYVLTEVARAAREGSRYPDWYREMCSRGARRFGLCDAFGVGCKCKEDKEVA